jgi:hypothetical protein
MKFIHGQIRWKRCYLSKTSQSIRHHRWTRNTMDRQVRKLSLGKVLKSPRNLKTYDLMDIIERGLRYPGIVIGNGRYRIDFKISSIKVKIKF